MEQSRHFYLTLPSDEGGFEFGGTNTNASYKIRLPHPIHLDENQEWEVGLVSVAFPLRNHQEYMFSHFWLGTSVAKIGAVVYYLERPTSTHWTRAGIEATVTMADIIDPYLPPKSGRQFLEHLILALQKALRNEALKGRSDWLPPATSVHWAANRNKDTHHGRQYFKWTDRGTLIIEGKDAISSGDVFVSFDPRLAEFIGIVETGSVTNSGARPGRRLNFYYPGSPVDIPLAPAWSVEIVNGRPRWIQLGRGMDWEISGIDDGWYETHMTHRNHVMHVLSNICDRSVQGGSHNSLLGTAKINAIQDGQSYHEPLHIRYLPVRQYDLDVVEIQLTEAKRLMNLGAGTTTVVLHVRPAIKVRSTENDKSNVEVN